MNNVQTKYHFDLSEMCPPYGCDQTLYSRFVSGLRVLAAALNRLLPEYDVEAAVWRDTMKLIFTPVEPDRKE